MESYPLSEEQIRFYRENGYVQLPDVLTAEELEETRAALAEAMQMRLQQGIDMSGRPEYDRIFIQKVNLWRDHAGMRRYVFNHKLAEIARALSGAQRIRLWHDHALVKMPQDSKPSAWHQDLPYWPMVESDALSCWMALDDVDENNGCMQFIAGTHKLGRLPPINLVEPQDIFQLVPPGVQIDPTPAVMRMKAGSCTFHHGLTFHYAGPNRSDRPRRAIVTIYMPDGTTYRKQPHVVTDGLGLEEGQPLAGELFPILAG